MGFNLGLRCETCRAQTGVLRGYESAAIAIFRRDHPKGHVLKLQVDNGWSDPEDEWSVGEDGYERELVYPPDYPIQDQPQRYIDRGY